MSLELSGTTPAIKGVAGSVAAPAITGDDADTGISFPSADTIKFSAGGVEKFAISASGLSGDGSGLSGISAGITMLDVWTISTTADATSSGGDLTANWVRANSYQATIGSAMTESSGVFTFPSTGIYEILFNAQFRYGNQYSRRYTTATIDKVISGSASVICEAASAIPALSGNTYSQARCSVYFDVTDVSTHKVQFKTRAEGSTGVTSEHSNGYLTTFVSFKRLGDT